MQIIRKETTPNGTDIQIEDWSEDYPGTFKKNATIGIYPIALNSIYHDEGFPEYPKRGEYLGVSLILTQKKKQKKCLILYRVGKNHSWIF